MGRYWDVAGSHLDDFVIKVERKLRSLIMDIVIDNLRWVILDEKVTWGSVILWNLLCLFLSSILGIIWPTYINRVKSCLVKLKLEFWTLINVAVIKPNGITTLKEAIHMGIFKLQYLTTHYRYM